MKTAIVTGASGNLGQAVVTKFLGEGYHVIGTVTPHDTGRKESAQFFETVAIDLQDEESVAQSVHAIVEHHERIDVAVLTVGGYAAGSIRETTAAAVLEQYKLNFQTAYAIARPIFLQMIAQGGGRIFLVGSRPGLEARHSKGMVAYGLAKTLIFRLAELLNEEGKQYHVQAVVIVPSTIDTPQNRKAMPDADASKWVKPEDIANIIYHYSESDLSVVRDAVIKVYGDA